MSDEYIYEFNTKEKMVSISQNNNINNIKNDFIIWGVLRGTQNPIHGRYVLDKKPTRYYSYGTKEKKGKIYTSEDYDWRELIYQMAIDYKNHNDKVDFYEVISQRNPALVQNGLTGYEQYYSDMEAFWRQLYNPNPSEDDKDSYNSKHWHVNVSNSPESLKFWIDFLDVGGELQQFSVKSIGDRVKAENNSKITSIYYKETPEVIIKITDAENKDYENQELVNNQDNSYTVISFPNNLKEAFSVSSKGNSTYSRATEMMNNHLLFANTLTISCAPIYYLEPNHKVKIIDERYGGDYLLDKISIPLTYNGTMNLTLNKIVNSIC